MAKFLKELFHVEIYKRSQGRIARQATFAALFIIILLGTWQLSEFWEGEGALKQFGIPGMLWLAGVWISYRLVNFPEFADFLISVEAEMNKVSWPSRSELFLSSVVVIFVIFFLAGILFGYDFVLRWFFTAVGVLESPPSPGP